MTFQKGEGVPPSITRALLPSCGHVGYRKVRMEKNVKHTSQKLPWATESAKQESHGFTGNWTQHPPLLKQTWGALHYGTTMTLYCDVLLCWIGESKEQIFFCLALDWNLAFIFLRVTRNKKHVQLVLNMSTWTQWWSNHLTDTRT